MSQLVSIPLRCQPNRISRMNYYAHCLAEDIEVARVLEDNTSPVPCMKTLSHSCIAVGAIERACPGIRSKVIDLAMLLDAAQEEIVQYH